MMSQKMIEFISKKIPCLSGEYHEHGKGKKIPKLPKSAPKSMLDLKILDVEHRRHDFTRFHILHIFDVEQRHEFSIQGS